MLGQNSTPGPQTQPTEFPPRGLLQPPSIAQLLKYNIYQSAEYRLRQVILWQYDKMVRPVLKPSDVINVTFQVDFKALSGVVISERNFDAFFKPSMLTLTVANHNAVKYNTNCKRFSDETDKRWKFRFHIASKH